MPTASKSKDDAVVIVHFTEPTEGADPDDGETFVATRHRVVATALHPSDHETIFIDSQGEVIARWPTETIERVSWPFGSPGGASGRPRFRSREWIAERRMDHPRAYERWDEAESQQLTDEFNDGLTVTEMAQIHGRGPNAIFLRLVSQELVAPDTQAGDIGKPPE